MKLRCLFLFLFIIFSTLAFCQEPDSVYNPLNTVIVTGNKLLQKRTEAPIAISVISHQTIEKANASRIDFLLNKVSGVYMPTIGGEQHMMSIRQPISLKGLYLYLEDGLPIRTSGLFSSNALIEINTSNIYSIELIKGPASALYGAEAIGGVINFISAPVPIQKQAYISTQVNSTGLKKIELQYGNPNPKGGWLINASFTDQKKGILDHSDYNKNALSIKKYFKFSKKLTGYQTLQYIHYYTQMTGSVDSLHFVNKDFSSLQSFTYRKLDVLRWRQNFKQDWNSNASTQFNILYRNNTMDQNPTYSIASTAKANKFKGQINSNHFNAFVFDLQHQWNFPSLNSKLIIGGYWDITKQNLMAHYIDILKDTIINKYPSYTTKVPDSLITSYRTQINNKALYLNYLGTISNTLKFNMALRFDHFNYAFNNLLATGTPSSVNQFSHWTPKLGFTYNIKQIGAYLNYSQGFVPPQITEIYNTVKIPYLLPQQFSNFEIGAWFQLKDIYGAFSIYQLNGENEIISVRQPDGVNLNQNAGSTKHVGIEYQLKYKINDAIQLEWNATNAKHTYNKTVIKGVTVDGNGMNAAPGFLSNASLYLKLTSKFNSSLEWHHQSTYFMDETNSTTYPGFNLLHLKFNYTLGKHTIWMHVLNATNTYYSTMATKNFSVKGNAAYSYYIGEPRSIAIGWKVSF
jgi:iron complex outermembrane receptor protein